MFENEMMESRNSLPLRDDRESVEYALELECILSRLEQRLHDSDDPHEIVIHALETACEFYGGDWAGFLEVDPELSLWTPYLWVNKNPDDHTLDRIEELESAEFFHRWVSAMKENQPVIISDCESIREEFPQEYDVYRRFEAKSVIAVPVKPFPTGYVVVRNPERYLQKSSMLQLLAFVVIKGVSEKKLIDRVKKAWSPESIRNENDVIINLFGELEIYTSRGVIREQDLKSPKISRLLAYLVTHSNATISPWEIAQTIWPDEADSRREAGKNIKYLVYRLRQNFSMISDNQIVESTPNGYRINPDLHIQTDMEMFDHYKEASESTSSIIQKVEFLKKAFDIYRGRLLSSADGEHWLMPLAIHYNLKYLALANELMKTLGELKDYSGIHYYAARVLYTEPGNVNAHFWLVFAAHRQGSTELAMATLREAERILTDEEYDELITQLKRIKDWPYQIRTPRDIR